MNVIIQRWHSLVPREQVVIGLLAALVCFLLFQTVVLNPLYEGQEKAKNSVEKQSALLHWMQQRSAQVKQLQAHETMDATHANHSLSQRINSSAAKMHIGISRFQTSTQDKAQVWIDKADFSVLLTWLTQLQLKQAVFVESIAVSETGQSGYVSVNASFSSKQAR